MDRATWTFRTSDPVAVRRWLGARAASRSHDPGPPGDARLDVDLFDTEEGRFRRAGYALAVRRRDGDAEAALEPLSADDSAEPLTARIEASGEESLRRAPDPLGERIRAVAGSRPLRRLLTSETRRSRWGISFPDGSGADAILDDVVVRTGRGRPRTRFGRIEIVAAGPSGAYLERFNEEVVSACRLEVPRRGVAADAIESLAIPLPALPDLGPTGIGPGSRAGELAFAVLRRQFEALLKNEPGTRLGADPEALHDMRVASRRLRAAVSLYAEALPVRARSFRMRLGRVGRALGEVRDLDVQIERLEAWRADLDPADSLSIEAYVDLSRRKRTEARRRMLRLLDSRGYDRLVESFAAFLRRGPGRRRAAARRPATVVAPDLIERRFRRVRRLGDGLGPDSSPSDLHAMRIRCKRLRYALEFHLDLYGEAAREMIEPLVALQDLLGEHQDAQVAMQGLREASARRRRSLDPRALFAMGRLAQRFAQRAEELRRRFPKLYARIRGGRWRRLRRLMESRRPPEPVPRRRAPTAPP